MSPAAYRLGHLLTAQLAIGCFCSAPAAAQTAGAPVMTGEQEPAGDTQPTQGERPYRGIFGATAVGPTRPGLAFEFGGYGGYDDDLLAAQSGQTGGPGLGGRYAGGNAGLAYRRLGQKLNVSANTLSDGRHYPALSRNTYSHSADLALDFEAARRTRIQIVQRVGFASLFRFGGLPGGDIGEGRPAIDDLGLSDQTRLTSNSSAQYTRELSNRSEFTANAGYRFSESPGSAFDLRVRTAGAAYTRQFTRAFNLRIGYSYRASDYGGAAAARRATVNGLDLGGGYRKALSFSRRTTLDLTGGLGRITQESLRAEAVTFNRAVGTVGLEHEMGRTWTLIGRYTRGAQFVEVFPDPFFVDSAAVTLSGLLSPRLELSTDVTFVNGRLQLTSTGSGYRSYAATSALAYALNRSLALSFNYAYFNYDFATGAGLPQGLAPALERQSIRAGIRWWVPVFGSR